MIISLDNIKINYEVEGEGNPLIMLHGNGESLAIFNKARAILSKHFKLYLIDSRNHGLSTNGDLSYSLMANDIYSFINKLNINKPIIYGFSDGGIIALILAYSYPNLLDRIIISGANISPRGLKYKTRLEIKKEYKLNPSPLLRLMLDEPKISTKDLRKIIIPTDIIVGSNDCIKYSETKKIKRGIKNSHLHIIENESHSSYIINSEKIAKLILKYLKIEG